jgi:hypothetical protein
MGKILQQMMLSGIRFTPVVLGSTPVQVAYYVAHGQAATAIDPAHKPEATLLYVMLGHHTLALDLFAPADLAEWQDCANASADDWEHDDAMEQAEADADRRRDAALCDFHAGVEA